MGLPWSHWNTTLPTAQDPLPPTQTIRSTMDPLDSVSFYHPSLLKGIVKDYVEETTDYTPNFATDEQIGVILGYCQAPELLDIVLDVLRDRLNSGWPWNIKALDVLLHLLQTGLHIYPPIRPIARELIKTIQYLSTVGGQDEPPGSARLVREKAGDCLVVAGAGAGRTIPAGTGMGWGIGEREEGVTGKGAGRRWGFGWGRLGKEQDKGKKGRETRQPVGSAWTGWDPESSSAWGTSVPAMQTTQAVSAQPNGVGAGWTQSVPSAWTTSPQDGKGFSFTTTTVSSGPPSPEHFNQHQTTHASLLEETLRKRG